MKKTLFIAAILFASTFTKADFRLGADVDFNYFYHSLAPYGEWISLDADLTVWRPNSVHYNWNPYSVGRWAWTNNGWYWDSYEPFGWATYHYGRWINDDYYGWIWLPDYEWAPAWVEWRYDNDYIGWAPLPPYASFNINFGIHFSIGWHSPYRFWNFVGYNHFCHNNVHDYFIHHDHVGRFFSNTKYRTNYYYENDRLINGGIDRRMVERRGGYRVAERKINRVDSYDDYQRGNRGSDDLRSYRPSGKDLNRYEGTERGQITKGSRSSVIEKDKVVVNRSRSSENASIERDNFQRGSSFSKPDRSVRKSDRPISESERKSERVTNEKRENPSKGQVFKRGEESVKRPDVSRPRTSSSSEPRSKTEVKRDNSRSSEPRVENRKQSNNSRSATPSSKTNTERKTVERRSKR